MKSFEQILREIDSLSVEDFKAFENELLRVKIPEDCEFSQIIDRLDLGDITLGEYIEKTISRNKN